VLVNVNIFNKEVVDEVPVSCINENATFTPQLMFAMIRDVDFAYWML
jgi:hypothetical protein